MPFGYFFKPVRFQPQEDSREVAKNAKNARKEIQTSSDRNRVINPTPFWNELLRCVLCGFACLTAFRLRV